jgi:hypothetical protein
MTHPSTQPPDEGLAPVIVTLVGVLAALAVVGVVVACAM